MNRLELAAQAPPIPDWYALGKNIIEGFNNLDNILKNNKDSINATISIEELEKSWRFYWADEMIKRNEQQQYEDSIS